MYFYLVSRIFNDCGLFWQEETTEEKGSMDTGAMVATDSLTTVITDDVSTTTPFTVSIRIETNTTTIIPYRLIYLVYLTVIL